MLNSLGAFTAGRYAHARNSKGISCILWAHLTREKRNLHFVDCCCVDAFTSLLSMLKCAAFLTTTTIIATNETQPILLWGSTLARLVAGISAPQWSKQSSKTCIGTKCECSFSWCVLCQQFLVIHFYFSFSYYLVRDSESDFSVAKYLQMCWNKID